MPVFRAIVLIHDVEASINKAPLMLHTDAEALAALAGQQGDDRFQRHDDCASTHKYKTSFKCNQWITAMIEGVAAVDANSGLHQRSWQLKCNEDLLLS